MAIPSCKYIYLVVFLCLTTNPSLAQISNETADSLYIAEVQYHFEPDKVLHAEPLFVDLIRDLGARKGEREWNVGLGLTDNNRYDRYLALIEYEWAPINRLGLEVELPFTFYYNSNGKAPNDERPSSKLNGLKFAAQYTFWVSQRWKTSTAIGYLNELETAPFRERPMRLTGNLYNPFFVGAKRWGNNWHTLIYAGPLLHQDFASRRWRAEMQWNTNIHYMITGTRNFVGVEFNKEWDREHWHMVMRPQMRVGLADNLLVGIVVGIPTRRQNERLSTFLRLIYEPPHHL
ncbi:MAG: HAEPLYID family protein [Saprospiraceae bacterium]|nr:hypothetical protein [Saprospiraceae bacterium]MDW8230007.1 HAEPLYID family protein [Saprospiraceae bacterium]